VPVIRWRSPGENLELRTKIFFACYYAKFFDSTLACASRTTEASTNHSSHADPQKSKRLKVANSLAIASFCRQVFGASKAICNNVQAHNSMRFARARPVTIICGADFAAAAMQNYSDLGNLPPLVSRLRVNV
jgi:hypothetical protein